MHPPLGLAYVIFHLVSELGYSCRAKQPELDRSKYPRKYLDGQGGK